MKGVFTMAKKLTIQQQYKRELKNLQKRIQRQEQKGYNVSRETILPKEKQRYTRKDIERVKNIKAKQIKESAKEFTDIRTGEVLPSSEAKRVLKEQREERKQESYVPSFNYIEMLEEIINDLPNEIIVIKPRHYISLEPYKQALLNTMYDAMNEYESEQDYNKYLSTVYAEIQDHLNWRTWDSSSEEEVMVNITQTRVALKGKPLTFEEATLTSLYGEID